MRWHTTRPQSYDEVVRLEDVEKVLRALRPRLGALSALAWLYAPKAALGDQSPLRALGNARSFASGGHGPTRPDKARIAAVIDLAERT